MMWRRAWRELGLKSRLISRTSSDKTYLKVPPPYKLILFDFDGTLVDTVDDITYYVNDVLSERGYTQASAAQVKAAIGWGVPELLKILVPAFSDDPADLESAVRTFKDRYRENPVRVTCPFPNVIEVLEGPLRKTPKAIITNKPQDIALRVLDELGMRHYFEEVIGTQGNFAPKPDPASSLYLMSRFDASAEVTVYVGDSPVDAQTSEAAGIDFAWMEYGYQDCGLLNPRFRFFSAEDWGVLVS